MTKELWFTKDMPVMPDDTTEDCKYISIDGITVNLGPYVMGSAFAPVMSWYTTSRSLTSLFPLDPSRNIHDHVQKRTLPLESSPAV